VLTEQESTGVLDLERRAELRREAVAAATDSRRSMELTAHRALASCRSKLAVPVMHSYAAEQEVSAKLHGPRLATGTSGVT
jgi:hypothetical protein